MDTYTRVDKNKNSKRKSNPNYILCGPEKGLFFHDNSDGTLGTLSANSSSKLNILGHDCNPFSVDGAQVGIFKQAD